MLQQRSSLGDHSQSQAAVKPFFFDLISNKGRGEFPWCNILFLKAAACKVQLLLFVMTGGRRRCIYCAEFPILHLHTDFELQGPMAKKPNVTRPTQLRGLQEENLGSHY